MRRLVLGYLLGFACFSSAQQQPASAQQQQPVGDVFESGSGAGAGSPAQAVQKLYELAARITDDPSSGYDAKTSSWPEADADWAQWDNAIGLNGNTLTQQQRSVLVPCAANLGAAIDTAERSYRIQISQVGNAPAQADAQQLKATARKKFELCNLVDAMNGSTGNPATGGANTGSQSGGASGGSGAPLQGGVSTGPSGTPGSGAPGTANGSPLLKTGISYNEPGPGTNGTGMPRSGAPGTILGSGPGTSPTNGSQPGSPASSSGPGSGSPPTPPASFQPTQDFRNKLLAAAQTILQNEGRIAKVKSDAMDPATHNNIGVGVGLKSLASAAGGIMGVVAQEFQALASASQVVGDEGSLLQIAGATASESGTMANQATQEVSQLETALAKTMGTGMQPAGAQPVAVNAPDFTAYRQGMVPYPNPQPPNLTTGELPICGQVACVRLGQILGRNIPAFDIIQNTMPKAFTVTFPNGVATFDGGLSMLDVAAGLRSAGINVQTATGIGALWNQVSGGNPVIAAVNAAGAPGSPWHALVIEGVENQGGVWGLKIFDPIGDTNWQPLEEFEKYFTGLFVQPK